ncbi:MAG: hypothetical protein OHK0022_06130 [Roseiflexaceae bacterium]
MLTQKQVLKEQGNAIGKRPYVLTTNQLAIAIVLGIAFWFVAALAVRFGSGLGFFGPTASVLAFAAGIPICWLSVRFSKKAAGLAEGQTLPGIAVGLIAATFCDGIALTWGRDLYGTDPALITFGAAWILWGVGLFLLFAYLEDLRGTGTAH